MDLLLNPNIAYCCLAGGMMLAILALISPGTGLLELSAFIVLGMAAWAMMQLPINTWALGVLVLGIVPFVASVRKPGRSLLLAVSILAMVFGSAFMFRSEVWWRPAVNPFLALLVSVLSIGYFWLAGRKVLEAESVRPVHDLEGLIGMIGEVRSPVSENGSVQVNGELWSAQSEQMLPTGAKVRVIGRDGLVLKVELVQVEK